MFIARNNFPRPAADFHPRDINIIQTSRSSRSPHSRYAIRNLFTHIALIQFDQTFR